MQFITRDANLPLEVENEENHDDNNNEQIVPDDQEGTTKRDIITARYFKGLN